MRQEAALQNPDTFSASSNPDLTHWLSCVQLWRAEMKLRTAPGRDWKPVSL